MYCTGPNAKGKVQVVAKTISEEELGGREGYVILTHAKDRPGIAFGGVGHVVVQVDAAFGEARATRAIEPEGAIILACLGSLEIWRGFGYPLLKVMHSRRLLLTALFQADDDDMSDIFEFWRNVPYL